MPTRCYCSVYFLQMDIFVTEELAKCCVREGGREGEKEVEGCSVIRKMAALAFQRGKHTTCDEEVCLEFPT